MTRTTPISWNKIPRGSKIHLSVAQVMQSFNGEPRYVKSGDYYITGFWVDMCGLNHTSAHGGNDINIRSRELTKFDYITE